MPTRTSPPNAGRCLADLWTSDVQGSGRYQAQFKLGANNG